MVDYDKFNEKIQDKLGVVPYLESVSRIADILAEIEDEKFESGSETELVEFVVEKLNAPVTGPNKKKQRYTFNLSLEDFEGIDIGKHITHITSHKQRIVAREERISILHNVKQQLKSDPTLLLSKMPSGMQGQTMNDWLSDAYRTKTAKSGLIKKLIDDIFALSKSNYQRKTKTNDLREKIPAVDLVSLSCFHICQKYGFDYESGTVRKLISRLRQRELAKIVSL